MALVCANCRGDAPTLERLYLGQGKVSGLLCPYCLSSEQERIRESVRVEAGAFVFQGGVKVLSQQTDVIVQIGPYEITPCARPDGTVHITIRRHDNQDEHDHWIGPERTIVVDELFKDT